MSRGSVCEVHESTPVRARRPSRAGAVASLSVAAALVLSACGGAVPEVTADVSPSPAASPTLVPSASPSPSPEVVVSSPDNPIAEVPWDDVGDGWFLVDLRLQRDFDWGVEHAPIHPLGESEGSLVLLSPDGDWYVGADYADTGAAFTWMWDREVVWWAIEGTSHGEGTEVVAEGMNMRTGAKVSTGGTFSSEGDHIPIGDRSFLALADGGGGWSVDLYLNGGERASVCDSQSFSPRDALVTLPDGRRQFVCMQNRGDGRTDVQQVTVGDSVTRTTLDVFIHHPETYYIHGWIDSETFVLSRSTEIWGDEIAGVWTYNVANRKITEAPISMVPDGRGWVYFDNQSQRRIEGDYDTQMLTVSTFEEELIVDISRVCDGARAEFSGTRALVHCWQTPSVVLIDIGTGEVLGEWETADDISYQAFGN